MAKGRSRQKLAIGLLFAGLPLQAAAQESTTNVDTSPTPTQDTSNSDVSASIPSGSEPSTTDVPLELWGIANSLLSSYYPSTTITNVADLTWPGEVVIGSSTYTQSPATSSDVSPSTSAISPPTSKVSPSTTPSSTLATVAVSSHDVSRPVTTDPSSANEAEPSNSPEEPSGHPKDRTLGIALGVVFGVLTVALMAFALICVHRRQKKHGGSGIFPSRRRRATSPTDSEVGAWRARHPHMGLVTTVAGPMSQVRNREGVDRYNRLEDHQTPPVHDRPSREWVDRYNRLADQQTPPVHLHPAFVHSRNDSEGRSSETNPFFTPAERSTENTSNYNKIEQHDGYHPGYPNKPGFNASIVPYTPYRPNARRSQSSHRRSSSSGRSDLGMNDRPPTPFSPMVMLQASSPPQQQQQPQPQPNPFTSAEDEDIAQRQNLTQYQQPDPYEEHDVVSPILPPSKSPARRNSPLVHYPSWSEVSEFNFTGEPNSAERNVRQQRSRSSGRDGYGRDRESVVGRTELA